MSKQPETLFGEQVDRDLKLLEDTWFFNVQMRAMIGIPDRIGLRNGSFFALELKMKGGRVSGLQRYVLEKIKDAGGFAVVVYPHTWAGTLLKLKEL